MNPNNNYYGLAQALFPKVVDKLVNRGEIAPPEAAALMQLNGGPQFNEFVNYMVHSFPQLAGEQQMEQQLYYRLIQPLYNDMRIRASGGYAAGGGGGYGYRGPAYGGGYGGGGGYNPTYMRDRGSTWYAGPRASPPAGGCPRGPGGQYYPNPNMREEPRPRRIEKKRDEKKEPPKAPWKTPEIDPQSKINHSFENNSAFALERFTGFDGANVVNAFVVDSRPRFLSDFEAIQAYRSILETGGESRKFLTVCYNKMHVIRADRGAFKNLVKAVSNAVSNVGADNVKDRLRMVISISKDHLADAKEAYERLILDEFNYHVLCGELLDSNPAHINWAVTANSLQGLYDLLTGDIEKTTRDTLHQIKDFDKRLETIVSRVIDTVVLNADKRIFDPISDKSIMDIYGRAVPPIWRNDRENVWEYTESFFMKYLSSIKTVNGSKPQSAVVAEQNLHTKLTLTDKNYTVFLVPRIITWNNSPASDVITFNEDGSVAPTLIGGERPLDNDIAFFMNTVFKRAGDSKLTQFAVIPHSVLCESKGTVTRLNYGITSDGCMYVGAGTFE